MPSFIELARKDVEDMMSTWSDLLEDPTINFTNPVHLMLNKLVGAQIMLMRALEQVSNG